MYVDIKIVGPTRVVKIVQRSLCACRILDRVKNSKCDKTILETKVSFRPHTVIILTAAENSPS